MADRQDLKDLEDLARPPDPHGNFRTDERSATTMDGRPTDDPSGLAGTAPTEWDRAIFTSLPSPTGEGYRFVAWSTGVRLEERQELTRRAPSHGSLCGEGAITRGLLHVHLQSTGRSGWGFARVAGAEHTRRGGGRVWTDFLLREPAAGPHPSRLRGALAAAAPPKPPIGSAPLVRVSVPASVDGEAHEAAGAREAAKAAAVAGLLVDPRPCVVAAGADPASVFEAAMHMLPAFLRPGVSASAGLRFSPARGVKTTITDRIDQDALRATRGQGVECIDVDAKAPPAAAALAPWLSLMTKWWGEGQGAEAAALAARVGTGWKVEDLARVATVADSASRGELSREALDDFLASRGG